MRRRAMRTRLHLGGSAVEDHASAIDKDHAAGHGFHLLQDVGGEQDRFVLAELADGLADLARLVGIQSAGGFVHNQDVGFVQQYLRHADALAVALWRVSGWVFR